MLRGSSERIIKQEPDDLELIQLIQQGSELAWTLLLARHSGRVFSAAFRIMGQHACAEDIKQDVFLQLLRRPELFASVRDNLGAWLATSAKHRSIDQLRQRKNTDSIHDRDFVSRDDFQKVSDRRHVMNKLIPLIEALPAGQQELLHMSFFLGYSHSEIAKQTRRPLGSVKTVIRTAVEQLRSKVAA